jgi:hypothetical protein
VWVEIFGKSPVELSVLNQPTCQWTGKIIEIKLSKTQKLRSSCYIGILHLSHFRVCVFVSWTKYRTTHFHTNSRWFYDDHHSVLYHITYIFPRCVHVCIPIIFMNIFPISLIYLCRNDTSAIHRFVINNIWPVPYLKSIQLKQWTKI